jgi:hypothetical protein
MEISISSMNLRFKVKIFILSKRFNFNFKNVLSYFKIQLIKLILRVFVKLNALKYKNQKLLCIIQWRLTSKYNSTYFNETKHYINIGSYVQLSALMLKFLNS